MAEGRKHQDRVTGASEKEVKMKQHILAHYQLVDVVGDFGWKAFTATNVERLERLYALSKIEGENWLVGGG